MAAVYGVRAEARPVVAYRPEEQGWRRVTPRQGYLALLWRFRRAPEVPSSVRLRDLAEEWPAGMRERAKRGQKALMTGLCFALLLGSIPLLLGGYIVLGVVAFVGMLPWGGLIFWGLMKDGPWPTSLLRAVALRIAMVTLGYWRLGRLPAGLVLDRELYSFRLGRMLRRKLGTAGMEFGLTVAGQFEGSVEELVAAGRSILK